MRAFEKIGYQIARQRGSHVRLRNNQKPNCLPLSVPNHKALKPGLLRNLTEFD